MRVEASLHVLTACGGRCERVTFTTEHPASVRGLPVALVRGKVCKPGDLRGDLTTDSRDWRAVEAIRRAGYTVDAPATRPRPFNSGAFW